MLNHIVTSQVSGDTARVHALTQETQVSGWVRRLFTSLSDYFLLC